MVAQALKRQTMIFKVHKQDDILHLSDRKPIRYIQVCQNRKVILDFSVFRQDTASAFYHLHFRGSGNIATLSAIFKQTREIFRGPRLKRRSSIQSTEI